MAPSFETNRHRAERHRVKRPWRGGLRAPTAHGTPLSRLRLAALGLAILGLGAGCATAPAPGTPTGAVRYWLPSTEVWTRAESSGLRLVRQDQTTATVPAPTVRHLLAARRDIEARSGLTARLGVLDLGVPNAIATTRDGERVVAFSLAWLAALGNDRDAIATTLGHEYAHHQLGHHPQTRREREQAAAAGGQVVGSLLNLIVPFSGNLANLAITGLARGYTRDEERAADELGLAWAVAAGYDPCGRVRTLQMYSRGTGGAPLTFLSTHPGVEERMAYARTVAARDGRRCAPS